jgi:hypothetical protein
MGSIDFQITALHSGSANQAAENAHVPAAQATSALLPAREAPTAPPVKAQQDTVSLSGTPLPLRQQTSASRGNAQPATFELLSQTTTFPPARASAPAVSPTATEVAGQNDVPAAAAIPLAQSVAATQSTVASAMANPAATAARH